MNSRGFYIALEQRILLDAAGMATAVETLPDQIDNSAVAIEDTQAEEAIHGLLNAFGELGSESGSQAKSLIFIDSRVENPEQLLGNSLDLSAQIYTISPDTDGLAYIAEILGSSGSDLSSLHIISHGNSGELLLGNNHITNDSLNGADGQYLALLSDRMGDAADILIYACNVAEGEEGRRFVEKFALITSADVAASTDLTGAIALGGDADLEFRTGEIQAQQVISTASLTTYSALLGTPDAGGNATLTNTSDSAVSVTEDTASASDVRLTVATLNDAGSANPTEIRILSVTGGSLTQSDGSPITLGASGTKLALSDLTGTPHYDFKFVPEANRDTAATFSYVVVESGGNTNSAPSTATISITAVNDAPTGGNVSLPNINEDTSSPAGVLLSGLFPGSTASFSDVDSGSSFGGIAVVGNSADLLTQGRWEYSTNGSTFFEIGTVGDGSTALALSSATQIRFVPVADYNGAPPALSIRVMDNTQTQFTSGGSRVVVDSSANGGDSGIAATTTTVGITVDAVNDAPSITEGGVFTDILEDQAVNDGVTVSSFLNGLVEDGEDNAANIGLAITGTTLTNMSGTGSDWQYSTDGGTSWNSVGTVSNTSALLLAPANKIRFLPAADQVGNATLSYKVWDGSSGMVGAKEDLTAGDTNRVSAAAFSSNIAVTPVNDDPANLTTNSKTINEKETYVLSNADIAFTAKAGAPDEQIAEQIAYKLTTLATKGDIQKQFGSTWVTLSVGCLFSQQDIDSGDVRYVHTGAELNANTTDSFAFTVRDGAGSEINDTFDLTINNINASLSLTGTSISVNERIGSETTDVNVITIGFSDADNTDSSQIQFTLKSLPGIGRLEIDKGAGFVAAAASDTFTKVDLDAGKLRYVHDGSEPVGGNSSTTFTVDATDNSSPALNTAGNPSPSTVTNQVITLNITPINDTPAEAINIPTVSEGASVVIDENFIDFTDPDSPNTQFTIVLDSAPSQGALLLNGVRLGVGSMLLRSDLLSNNFVYQHFGANPDADPNTTDDSFNFTMRDRDGATITTTLGIKVTPDDSDNGANNVGEAVLKEGATHTVTTENLARTNTGTTYTLTALPSHGVLKLGAQTLDLGANNTFTAADVSGNQLTYVHNDTENFSDTFTFTADAAAGNVFDLVITPVNEPPVIDVPAATPTTFTVLEHDDTATTYGNTQDVTNAENAFRLTLAVLTGSDVDAPPNADLRYELTGKPPGGEIKIWNGSAYQSLTKDRFTVQDVIDGKVAYFHNANSEPNAATDKFTLKLTDGGGVDSAPKTINIVVTNVNDAPSTAAASFTVSEGATQNLQSILNGKFSDTDADDTPANLVLVVTAIPNASAGVLKNTNTSTTLAVNSTFTKADLDSGFIVYEHNGGEVFSDTFSFKARDDGSPNLESSPDVVTVTVRPVNDDPVISKTDIVLGDDKYENETFIIKPANLSATDPDNSDKQVQFRVTANTSAGVIKLSGKVLGVGSVFTLDDVKNDRLTYEHVKQDTLTDAFTFKVSDAGGGNEPEQTFNIALNPVNDSPEVVVPKAVTLLEDGSKTITGITISDVDSTSNNVVTTLTVTKGTITFANTTLGGAVVAGAGGSSLTITGTVAQVNTMLAQGVQFTGDANAFGADTLTISVNDQGNTGIDPSDGALAGKTLSDTTDTGGAADQQVTKTVGITIQPLNDAPAISFATATASLDEDTSVNFGNLSFSDIDAGSADISVTLSVDSGSTTGGNVTVIGTPVAGVEVSSNGTKSVVITGPLADINTLLNSANSFSYAPGANFNGSDVLTVVINDLGNTGAGGTKTATQTTAITINPINDAPVISTPVSVTGNEDTNINVVLTATDADLAGNPNNTVTDFTVTTLPDTSQGVLFKEGGSVQVVANTLLTKAEAEKLVFVPTAEFNGTVNFQYTATDGALTSSLATGAITVAPVNDGPGITVTSTGIAYTEGSGNQIDNAPVDLTSGSVVVTDIELITQDIDTFESASLEVDRKGSNNGQDVFSLDLTGTGLTASSGSAVGSEISRGADKIGEISTNSAGQIIVVFTANAEQADVNKVAESVYYKNTSDNPPSSIVIDFRFKDGNEASAQGSGGNLSATAEVTVAITKTNDAPVAKNATYTSAEDAGTPSTYTLSQANLLNNDPDNNAMSFVALVGNTANSTTQGSWQAFVSGSWVDVGTVSDASARVLAIGAMVRFVPVAEYNGTPPALDYRLIDNDASYTDGAGTAKNVSVNGGVTAISAATASITATINSVNDAPVLAGNQLSPTAIESGGSTGLIPLLNSTGTVISATDVDATHFDGGSITVSLDTYVAGDLLSLDGVGAAQGIASTAGGTGSNLVINLNATATIANVNIILAAIRYSYTGDNPTDGGSDPSRVYSIKLNDGGQSNGPSNTGTTGVAKDSNLLTGTITLQNENDSPVGANGSISVAEDATNPAGVRVNTLAVFTDKDGDSFGGLAVSANLADAATEVTVRCDPHRAC